LVLLFIIVYYFIVYWLVFFTFFKQVLLPKRRWARWWVKEWPVSACSGTQDDGQSACYTLQCQSATLPDSSCGPSAHPLNKFLDFVRFHHTLLDYVLSFRLCMTTINICFRTKKNKFSTCTEALRLRP